MSMVSTPPLTPPARGGGVPRQTIGDSALAASVSDPATPPLSSLAAAQAAKLWKAARDFEAMALGELLRPMFDTIDAAHGPFGGGEAEAAWRPMQIEAIGKQMAAGGGLGLAPPVFTALVRAQEAHQGGSA